MLSKLPTSSHTIFVFQSSKSVTNQQYSLVKRSLIVGSLFETIYDHDNGDVITSAVVALEAVG